MGLPSKCWRGLDPLTWFAPDRRWKPDWLRVALSLLLIGLTIAFVLTGPFVSFAGLRDSAARLDRRVAWTPSLGLALAGLVGAFWVKVRGSRTCAAAPSTTWPALAGGTFYPLVLLAMCVWWTLSTHLHEVENDLRDLDALWRTATEHPTVAMQWDLCIQAMLALFVGSLRVVQPPEMRRAAWFLSFALFLCAQLLMISDTDLHRDLPVWLEWRCWNFGIIVPSLIGGLLVINGFPVLAITLPALCAIAGLLVYALIEGRVF